MSIIKQLLREAISIEPPINGEAPAAVPTAPVLSEPDNGASYSDDQQPNIYELYPDLAEIDITSTCSLSDFFASLCEEEIGAKEDAEREEYIPSIKDMNTPEEF